MDIAICDDCVESAELIEELVQRYFSEKSISYKFHSFIRTDDVIYELQDGMLLDIVFLSVRMYSLDFVNNMRENGFNGDIIYLSFTPKHDFVSFDRNFGDYLEMPYSYEKLKIIIDKIIKYIEENVYSIKRRYSFIRIDYDDIMYIESDNSKCRLFTDEGREYVIYKRLDEIEKELPDRRFLRCHRSFIVNMNYIAKVDKHFTLKDGQIRLIKKNELRNIRQIYYNFIHI